MAQVRNGTVRTALSLAGDPCLKGDQAGRERGSLERATFLISWQTVVVCAALFGMGIEGIPEGIPETNSSSNLPVENCESHDTGNSSSIRLGVGLFLGLHQITGELG